MGAAHPCNRAPHRVDLPTLAINGCLQGAAQPFPQGSAQGGTHVKKAISPDKIKSFVVCFNIVCAERIRGLYKGYRVIQWAKHRLHRVIQKIL